MTDHEYPGRGRAGGVVEHAMRPQRYDARAKTAAEIAVDAKN
jgi:hypothetical protein